MHQFCDKHDAIYIYVLGTRARKRVFLRHWNTTWQYMFHNSILTTTRHRILSRSFHGVIVEYPLETTRSRSGKWITPFVVVNLGGKIMGSTPFTQVGLTNLRLCSGLILYTNAGAEPPSAARFSGETGEDVAPGHVQTVPDKSKHKGRGRCTRSHQMWEVVWSVFYDSVLYCQVRVRYLLLVFRYSSPPQVSSQTRNDDGSWRGQFIHPALLYFTYLSWNFRFVCQVVVSSCGCSL